MSGCVGREGPSLRGCPYCGSREQDVVARRCNHSAFNGYRRTPSRYSAVRCLRCKRIRRTAAQYVRLLPDAPADWARTG